MPTGGTNLSTIGKPTNVWVDLRFQVVFKNGVNRFLPKDLYQLIFGVYLFEPWIVEFKGITELVLFRILSALKTVLCLKDSAIFREQRFYFDT